MIQDQAMASEMMGSFQKALSEGWVLHGSPSYAFDAATQKMRCGQAVTKTVRDQAYDPDKKLVDYR